MNPEKRSNAASRGASWDGRGRNERQSGGAKREGSRDEIVNVEEAAGGGLLRIEAAKEREGEALRSLHTPRQTLFSRRKRCRESDISRPRAERKGPAAPRPLLDRRSVSTSREFSAASLRLALPRPVTTSTASTANARRSFFCPAKACHRASPASASNPQSIGEAS